MSNLLGLVGFLFLFWRQIKEDYSSNQIFSFGFIVAGFILLGFLIGNFWGAFILGCIGFEIAFTRFKLRFFETLEAASLGFIFWVFINSIVSSIQIVDLKLLLYACLLGSLIPLFFFLHSRYKSFTWYKSGKIGFSGLSVMGILFLTRTLVALIDPVMLSFIGKFEAIIDILVAFAFFITLFKLGEV